MANVSNPICLANINRKRSKSTPSRSVRTLHSQSHQRLTTEAITLKDSVPLRTLCQMPNPSPKPLDQEVTAKTSSTFLGFATPPTRRLHPYWPSFPYGLMIRLAQRHLLYNYIRHNYIRPPPIITQPTCLHTADLISHSPRACTPWEWMTENRCSRTMVHGATAPAACRFDLRLSTEEKKRQGWWENPPPYRKV